MAYNFCEDIEEIAAKEIDLTEAFTNGTDIMKGHHKNSDNLILSLAPTAAPLEYEHTTVQSMDVLAAVFFVVAAGWLLLAIMYACLALVFLRLRARGQLDRVYDEDFGRLYLCRGYYIPFGWLLRRYIAHIQRESGQDRRSSVPVRFMSREERRCAMEVLLINPNKSLSPSSLKSPTSPTSPSSSPVAVESGASSGDLSTEGPTCSICLAEYEEFDNVLSPATCPHKFHCECILDWLQRQNNIECPCCRVPMVAEDEVWKAVQRLRKERRKMARLEKRRRSKPDAPAGGEVTGAAQVEQDTDSADESDLEAGPSRSTESSTPR